MDHNFSANKPGFAVALISNCRASNNRLTLIRELQRYIPVKIYGKCGVLCPTHFKNNRTGNCRDIIAAEFKFFFAFENSICKDYITEKISKHSDSMSYLWCWAVAHTIIMYSYIFISFI